MKCNMDCFNCPFPDCINDDVKPYDAEIAKQIWENRKDEINEKRRAITAERKANGICISCGKRPIAKNSTCQCTECLLKNRRRKQEKHKKNGGSTHEMFEMMGLCKTCGKSKPVVGYKICESCLEKSKQNMALARSSVKDNWFRKSNSYYAKNPKNE